MNDIYGILVVDKPRGWTSHDVVKKTKHLLGIRKVGHTGTLDPMATGVLILLIGRATKAAKLFENDRKRYLAEVTFGRATDTYDATGETTETGDPSTVKIDTLSKLIDGMKGEQQQVPPMFSAVKVDGKRLYKLARTGKTIERKPRAITIYRVSSVLSGYPTITIDIECSKGTYVRSLAHHLGETVGCPAHLSNLRRTASGDFTLREAVDFLSCAETNDSDGLKRFVIPFPVEVTK